MSARGGTAVHILKARFMAADTAVGPVVARDYLKSNCGSQIFVDRETLLCYYRLWWRSETKEEGFFDRDHLTLKFDQAQWSELADLARARLRLEGEQDNCMALFHLGWALLQTGHSADAKEAFDHLELVSIDSYRRGRTLAILSRPDGTPRELIGESRGRRMGNRGVAWVDELRMEVPYSMHDFDDAGGRPGRRIGPFHLALNYRGIFAQPTFKIGGGKG
jgi:hypothetical protein